MHILTLGLNHKTAPIEIRERAAVTADHLEEALQDLIARPGIKEAALLSTSADVSSIKRKEGEADAGEPQQGIVALHMADLAGYV